MEPVVLTPPLDGAVEAAIDGNYDQGPPANKVTNHSNQKQNNTADLHSKLLNVDTEKGDEIAALSENLKSKAARDSGNPDNAPFTDDDVQNSSPMDPRHIGSEAKQPYRLDRTKIEKAEAFLRNPEIRDVSISDKRAYLRKKIGMSPDEIDSAMDRVALDDKMEPRIRSQHDLQRNLPYSRSNRRYVEIDEGDQFQRLPLLRARRSKDEYYDDRDEHEFDGSSPRGRNINPRRHLVHDTEEYSHPRHMTNYGGMNAYNQQGPINNHMQYSDTTEESPPASSFFSLPAWAGGFSLGVFFLAALRWLNGGDFVLFPPPNASKQRTITQTNRGDSDNDDENTDESSESQQQEECDDGDGIIEQHLNEQRISDIVADSEKEDVDQSEDEEMDKTVNNILNGTADARTFHPSPAQPSFDNLVLEIRSLTSAIHSFRDAQERANRVVSAKVGRDVTDDAMDFLRMKKSVSVAAKEKTSEDSNKKILTQEEAKSIGSILEEATKDLQRMKGKISNGGETKEIVGKSTDETNEDSGNRHRQDIKGVTDIGEDSSKPVDEIVAKIEQVLAMIQKQDIADVSALPESDDKEKEITTTQEKEEECEGNEQITPSDIPDTKPTEVDSSINSPESTNFDTGPITSTTGNENGNEEIEECLKVLSNENDPHSLKIGSQMLYLYCLNISKNPAVPRYRKIYTNNTTFRTKVGNLVGAKEFLKAIGFEERPNIYEWSQSTDGSDDTRSKLDFALVALELLRNGPKKQNDDAKKTRTPGKKKETFRTDITSETSPPSSPVTTNDDGKSQSSNNSS
mmetsp:Transcript_9156/g.19651  ORF Transcript_9156/g.19651 Transcript_9156/m.19651 type:complete len:798 (+) Transcript_9156:185-2578(+)